MHLAWGSRFAAFFSQSAYLCGLCALRGLCVMQLEGTRSLACASGSETGHARTRAGAAPDEVSLVNRQFGGDGDNSPLAVDAGQRGFGFTEQLGITV